MNSSVRVSRGDVVGIGKIKVLPSNVFPYEIPMLSFLVIKEAKDIYAAVCIHLRVEGDGASPDEAREDMQDRILEFLLKNFKGERANGRAWDYLNELFVTDDVTRELWDAYRASQIRHIQSGVQTGITADLLDEIKSLEKRLDTLKNVKEKMENRTAEKTEIDWEYQEVA